MSRNKIYCTCCGEEVFEDEVCYIDDKPYCQMCYDELSCVCDVCGTTFLFSENRGNDSMYLCPNCYDSYYFTCADCGEVVSREHIYYDSDDNCYCRECYYKNHDERVIHDYGYKPDPIFYGSGRYIGVELEIDEGDDHEENAEKILSVANKDKEHIYIKNDGSLDEGMEIVSHPMTLDYHTYQMPWKAVLSKALERGYLSHKTSTCGLHCHVDRLSLGDTYDEQEKTIGKILFIIERFWDEFLKFSRRTEYQMNRWAARYGFKEKPYQVLHNAKNSALGRYACVNLNNKDTIEFRMWRGTLKYNTFIATLQMVETICSVAYSISEEELESLSWFKFIDMIDYPELIRYLKERRLYPNEPVNTEEEM